MLNDWLKIGLKLDVFYTTNQSHQGQKNIKYNYTKERDCMVARQHGVGISNNTL